MRRIVLVLLLAAALVPAVRSFAATPDSGTVTATAGSLSYAGAEISAVPPAASRRVCLEDQNCDTFQLTVNVPSSFYKTADRVLTATIAWTDSANDLDLYVCSGSESDDPECINNLVASSTSTGTKTETVTVKDPAPGLYRVIAAAYGGDSAYKGTITFAAPKAVTGPAPVRSTSNGFAWQARAVANDSNFGEPSIDVNHAGDIFVVAPGGAGVQMWRSFDGGFTFDHREIGSSGGGGDSEIEFSLNDVGYTADLEITDSAVSRSTNDFKTFTQQTVGIEMDRQWLAHKCSRQVFLGYHDFVLEGEFLNRSGDGGKTWDQVPTPMSPSGSAPGTQDVEILADQDVNTFSGPVVVDQHNGNVYVVFAISTTEGNVTTGTPPFGDPEQVVVAASHDNGHTFKLHLVQGGEPGTLAGVIFPWITIDRAGTVYVSYAGRAVEGGPINVMLVSSSDGGDTWSKPYRVNKDATGHSHIYTTISAGDAGVVDVAWYTGSTTDPDSSDNVWHLDFAQVRKANTASPQIKQSRPYPAVIHKGDICLQGILCELGGDRSLLDFFQIQVGPDGRANIAFANNASPDGTQRVWYVGQTGGPSAGNGLQDTNWCKK